MKRFLLILSFAITAALAADTPDGVPKGATKVSPTTYRYVDKDGKAWIYRQTPFGYTKQADEPKPAEEAAPDGSRATPFGPSKPQTGTDDAARSRTGDAPAKVETKVTEDGDMVHFERPSPFGTSKWSRKKTELNREEQRLLDAQRKPAPTENENK
jgi:hypothetical protein